MSTSHERRVARRLRQIDRRLRATERAAQASQRSVEQGSVDIYDADGELIQQVGYLEDGTVGTVDLNPTPPPTPTTPEVVPGAESINVEWDGQFLESVADGVTIAKVTAHMVPVDDDDFEPDDDNEIGEFSLGSGALYSYADADVPQRIALVAVSAAGVRSDPSTIVTATPSRAITPVDLEPDGIPPAASPAIFCRDGVGQIWFRFDPILNPDPNDTNTYQLHASPAPGFVPEPDDPDTLLGDLSISFGSVASWPNGDPLPKETPVYLRVIAGDADGFAAPGAVGSAEVLAVGFDEVSEAVRDAIEAADGKAIAAQEQADAANDAAVAAATAAATAQAAADGAIRTWYQSTAPTGLNDTTDLGDLWFDTDDNQAYRWGGSGPGWVLIQDNSIAAALATAAAAQADADAAVALATTAQSTANGKNTVTYGPVASPSTAGRADGDLHYVRTSGGSVTRLQRLVGGTWVTETLDGGAGSTVLGNIDAGKITTGFLNVAVLLEAGSILADKIGSKTLTSEQIQAGTITADELSSGAITTDKLSSTLAVLGSLFIGTGLGEGSISCTPPTIDGAGKPVGGIVVKDNITGEVMIQLHPAGSTFNGSVITQRLTVVKDLQVNGATTFTTGSVATLKSGVADPVAGPELSAGAHSTTFPPATTGWAYRGLAQGPAGLVAMQRRADKKVAKVKNADGSDGINLVPHLASNDITDWAGLAIAGTVFYSCYQSAGSWFLARFTSGSMTTTYVQLASGGFLARPTVGWHSDGNLLVAGVFGTELRILKLDPTTLTPVGSIYRYADWNPGNYNLTSVNQGTFDSSSAHYVVTAGAGATALTASGTTLSTDASRSWDMGASAVDGGVCADASSPTYSFQSLHGSASGEVRRWSKYLQSGDKFWGAKYADTDGANTTKASNMTVLEVPNRTFVTATVPPAAIGVTGWDLYVGQSGSAGGPGTLRKRPEAPMDRSRLLLQGLLGTGSTTVPTASTMASGTPAKIKSESGVLELNGDGSAKIPYIMPPGTILPWMGQPSSPVPPGFLLAAGGTQSIESYPDLAAALGTTYGGNGTTTFGLPDLRGRIAVGLDESQTEFDNVGETGGAKSVSLSSSQMPSSFGALKTNAVGGESGTTDNGGNSLVAGGTSGRYNSTVTVGGAGAAHQNLQPYIVVRYIIKV